MDEQLQQEKERRSTEMTPHIPPAKKKGHCVRDTFLAFILTICITGGLGAFYVYRVLQNIDTYVVPAQEEPYELKEGSTVAHVIRDLTDDEYHPRLVDLWVKLNRTYYPVIQRGPYAIDGEKTIPQLLSDMRDGNVVKIKLPSVPLIEGMSLPMIERRLRSIPDLVQDPDLSAILAKPEEFIKTTLAPDANDQSLLQAIGGVHSSLEGLLMPATYEYIRNRYSTVDMLEVSLLKMATFMRDHYLERDSFIDKVVKTPYEVLILASLVEKESALPQERPLIAGVFINRLRRGMRLQTDPAVMYGVSPDFRGPLRASQLKKDTPYNTYMHTGLPPTPIAMPSESSILAVLRPAISSHLYFVAKGPDPKEGHNFSRNLSEHNRAVQQYRKAVREYRKAQAAEEANQNVANTNVEKK